MRLTEEQHLLVEAAQGKPIDVLDSRTNRAYVLLPAEQFQRVRGIVEAAAGEAAGPSTREKPLGIPLPVKLRELATPPEVAEAARKWSKQLGFWWRKDVQVLEDELKLQYYFGGQYVAYLPTKDGPVLMAAGRSDSHEVGRQLAAVPPTERRKLHHSFPTVWNDQDSELLTPFADED